MAAFDDYVERIPFSECWIWTGAAQSRGYGRFGDEYAHRYAYAQARGPIPDGFTIDHLCRQKLSVNPAHLEAVTRLENHRRWAATITHCARGHEFTKSNSYVRPDTGNRMCRECIAIGREADHARQWAALDGLRASNQTPKRHKRPCKSCNVPFVQYMRASGETRCRDCRQREAA